MKRRFNETLYLTEDIVQKLGEGRHLGPWDFANLFFPRDTNRKQFECAFKFLSEMNKVGEMTNSEVRHILDDPKDKVMLMSHVIPKLQKFGVIRTDAENGSRRYNIRFSRRFTNNFINMSMDWLVYYSKHHNEKLKLEGNPIE